MFSRTFTKSQTTVPLYADDRFSQKRPSFLALYTNCRLCLQFVAVTYSVTAFFN